MSRLDVNDAAVRRAGHFILQPTTVTIAPGELIGLAGPNGSGKSTLLRLLAGLWRPDQGAVLLDGRTLRHIDRNEIARHIGFVPQDTHLPFAFRVDEMVSMGRYPHRGRFAPATDQDRKAVALAMEDCDITHLAERTVDTLSGGERQRVLIARSIAADPRFLLLDEPTANLDVQHTLEILSLCTRLTAAGRTVVVATHDLNTVVRFASRMLLMSEGRVVANGLGDEVLSARSIDEVFHVQSEIAHTSSGEQAFIFHKTSRS